MKLRFEVDQAEAFRQGIDVPKSIVAVEVAPSELSQEQRNLIADRLHGIDVCPLVGIEDGVMPTDRHGKPLRIIAKLPTFESLMEAIVENQRDLEVSNQRMRKDSDCEKAADAPCDDLLDKYLGKSG